MPSEVILPRVDMDMATGKISKWLVAPGATVAKGQPLFEIETDKATMEIEAEAAGTIRDLTAAGAADIPVGSTVAWIYAADEGAPPRPTAPAAAAPAQPAVADPRMAAAAPPRASAGAAPSASAASAGASGGTRATPLARRLARENGVDLAALRGSGPRGRIQAADIAGLHRPAPASQPQPARALPAADLREPQVDTRAPARLAPVPSAAAVPAPGASVKQIQAGVGSPLLLVHGFGSEANGWRPFLQGLPLSRPVFGLDLPGHGTSPLGAVAGFDDLVEAAGAAAAGLGAIHVVAHSLGAAVMTEVAARGAADIRSLLLLSPAGLGPDINGGFVRGYLDAASEASLTPWMRELVADPQAITPAFISAVLRARKGTDLVDAQRRLADAVFPDGTQSFSTRAALAQLRMPTRIVFGTADRIIPARHASTLPGLVALHLLSGVGHMPQLEARDTVAAIMGQMSASSLENACGLA